MFGVVEEEQTAGPVSTTLTVEKSIDPLSVSLLEEPAQSSSATMTYDTVRTQNFQRRLRVVAGDFTDVI
jgi:hypothetical protein